MAIEPVSLHQCLKAELLQQGLDPSGSGLKLSGYSIKQAAADSLVNSFLKKLETGRTSETDKAALEKFLSVNSTCKSWSLPQSLTESQKIIIGTVRQCLWDFWCSNRAPIIDHPFQILERGRIGPGANIGARGQDFYTKFFSSPLTTSDRNMYHWYMAYIAKFPDWFRAELIRNDQYGRPRIVQGSRLSFVPKNDEISRCICIEPTLNTYFQLGFGAILEERLDEKFGISLSDQPFRNRNLARLGSITNSLSTIDLSSASDSMSLGMLKYILPADFYNLLVKYRSPVVEIDKVGTVALNMVSTMGNGFTFPLQTILFSAVVVSCMKATGIRGWNTSSANSWGVFGDDIICPKSCTPEVIDTLTLLGFKVNDDKSFVEGPFRESCGSDFFLGSDIRGVYVKRLDTPESRYSVINLLTRFSTKTGISLCDTIRSLLKTVEFLPVPPWEDMSSGVHVPLRSVRKLLLRDKNLQSYLYRARVPRGTYLRFGDASVHVPYRTKKRIFNPEGLLISFLQGSIHSSKIGVRVDSVPYRTKRRVAPSWDVAWTSEPESQDYGLDWGRWNSVVDYILEIE